MKLPHGIKVRPRWWSFVNRTRGLKLGPVGRYRCCDHTTPYHFRWCPQHPSAAIDYPGPDPSVKCAYLPCTNRLRRADHGGEQWCSKAHREATPNDRSSTDG